MGFRAIPREPRLRHTIDADSLVAVFPKVHTTGARQNALGKTHRLAPLTQRGQREEDTSEITERPRAVSSDDTGSSQKARDAGREVEKVAGIRLKLYNSVR